jgi:hypothetical protein
MHELPTLLGHVVTAVVSAERTADIAAANAAVE